MIFVSTPLGTVTMACSDRALTSLRFVDVAAGAGAAAGARSDADAPMLATAEAALARYFAGDLDALDDLAVAPQGTEFQLRVWRALRRIAPGTTTSYGALARALGLPRRAARAVGSANRANPIALVVPCHRVLGADGALTGYAYGVERKAWLIAHESARRPG
jgi:methylated-DNA-[protein]-cysteine S-methyltransferase